MATRWRFGRLVRFRSVGAVAGVAIAVAAQGSARSQAAPRAGSYRAVLDELANRPNGLRADDVSARAVNTNFDLQKRHAELLAAEARVDQAKVAYYPRLTGLARYARLSHIEPQLLGNFVVAPGAMPGPLAAGQPLVNAPVAIEYFPNYTLLQASLAVPLLDYIMRIPSMSAAAQHNHEAALWTERATRAQVATEARVLYYSWVRARMQTVIAKQTLAQAHRHLDQVKHAFEVGAASKADVLRVDAQVSGAEVFVTRANDLDAVLEDGLHTLLHDGAFGHFEVGDDIQKDLPAVVFDPAEKMMSEAWANRAELRAVRAGGEALQAQVDLEDAGKLPHLDLVADGAYANPNPRIFPPKDRFDTSWDVGVQLTWVPNELAAAVHGARGARQTLAANNAEQNALRDALRAEVMRAQEDARAADESVRSAGRQLDSAEESYRVRLDLFQAGRSTNIEMTDSETDLTQAALSLVNARIDQRISRARLQHALGRDLGDKP
jgi:outer membrane protein TolC